MNHDFEENLESLEILDTEEPVIKNRRRAYRRKTNLRKAIRKQRISKTVNHTDWYKHTHQYSKNKIHCSCPMCRFKNAYNPEGKTYRDMKNDCRENFERKNIFV